MTPAPLRSSSVGPQRRTLWAGGDRAELVLFGGRQPGGATLAWQVNAGVSDAAYYVSIVDATSGDILWRSNMVHSDTGDGNAWTYYPGAPSGGTAEPVTFPVRNGTELRGNNAHVYKDLIDSIQVPGKPAPDRAEIPARSGLDWSGYTVELDTTSSARDCSAARPCTWNHNRAFSWRRNANHTAVQVYYRLHSGGGQLPARQPAGRGPGRRCRHGADQRWSEHVVAAVRPVRGGRWVPGHRSCVQRQHAGHPGRRSRADADVPVAQ